MHNQLLILKKLGICGVSNGQNRRDTGGGIFKPLKLESLIKISQTRSKKSLSMNDLKFD